MTLPLRLIIGYGNTLRQDDGVGYRVAEFLAAHPPVLNFCQIQALAVHQLTPDLAAAVAVAAEVIFVDLMWVTGTGEPRVQLQPLLPLDRSVEGTIDRHSNHPDNQVDPGIHPLPNPPQSRSSLGHTSDPHSILYLSDRLFGVAPPGYWLLIPGSWGGFGEELSPLAQRGMQEAITLLQRPSGSMI